MIGWQEELPDVSGFQNNINPDVSGFQVCSGVVECFRAGTSEMLVLKDFDVCLLCPGLVSSGHQEL